jgi:16S rRNA processing protein RimM
MPDKVSIGRIRGYHGVKGYLKLHPYFRFPERAETLSQVFVGDLPYAVEHIAGRGSLWLVKFRGLENREQAAHLQGQEVMVPREERFPLPPDHFYVDDLVGLRVYEESGRYLGSIREVLLTGANDVYVIATPPGAEGLPAEILFPALKSLVRSVDLEGGKVVVQIPAGLF